MSYQNLDARIVVHESMDDKGWVNENTLAQAYLTKPDEITPFITYLKGNEADKFPLSFLTEGNNKLGYTDEKNGSNISDIEFTWKVFGKIKNDDVIVKCDYTTGDEPGSNHAYFNVYFKTKLLKRSHLISSPNNYQARVMKEPEKVATNMYKYTCQLLRPDATYFVPLAELQPGVKWVTTSPGVVSNSDSKGVEHSSQLPATMKGQISVIRKSYHTAGNISNRVVECKFKVDGKETSIFVEWDRWMFETKFREECEIHLWTSEYNRKADGTIPLIDEDSGLPVPTTAGVFEQIPTYDTYSELTAKKLRNLISNVFSSNIGYSGNKTITLFTGLGGFDDFDEAMKNDLKSWAVIDSDKFITSMGGALMYRGNFKGYEDAYGNKIMLQNFQMLNDSSYAQNKPKHPKTGLPLCSHAFYGIDTTNYDGESNIRMIRQKGRSMIQGVEQGMSKLPGINYQGNDLKYLATDKDRSSLHYLGTKGININNNTNCFALECTLS